MSRAQTYSCEFKEKLLKEYEETKNLTLVSKRHDVPITTLSGWVKRSDPHYKEGKTKKKRLTELEKELKKKDLEIQMLKELLKKTNQAWLKD